MRAAATCIKSERATVLGPMLAPYKTDVHGLGYSAAGGIGLPRTTFMGSLRLSTSGRGERPVSPGEPTTAIVVVAIAGACAICVALVLVGLTYFEHSLFRIVVIALVCLGAFAAFVYNWRADASLLGSIGIAWAALCVTVGALLVIPLSGALLWRFLLGGWWTLLEAPLVLAVVLAGAVMGRAIVWCVPSSARGAGAGAGPPTSP